MQAVVFDVNETLSDLAGLDPRFAAVGAAPALRATWFAATLRDGIALAACGGAAPFLDIGAQTLAEILAGADLDRPVAAAVEYVLAGFPDLALHPDVVPGLRTLRDGGLRLASLTNGSAANSERMFGRTGVRDFFEHVLSVEQVGSWKPDPRVYALAVERLGTPAEETVMVAAHPWDLHGAASAGLRTAWVNRTGAAWPAYFTAPDFTAADMAQLAFRLTSAGK